jgi:hypothetical protein
MTVAMADAGADNGSVHIRLNEIDRANASAVEEQIRATISSQEPGPRLRRGRCRSGKRPRPPVPIKLTTCDSAVIFGPAHSVWVPNWSSTSCDLGVFVYQPVEQIATSQVKLEWRCRWW